MFTSPLSELGAEFLFVDGRCHYWLNQPSSIGGRLASWRPYREGTLTVQWEAALHSLTAYDDIEIGLPCSGVLPQDGSPISVWDGSTTHICNGRLQTDDASWPMRDVLYENGSATNYAMRLEVGQDAVPPDAPVYRWTLSMPPAAYEVSLADSMQFGKTKLVQGADAVALRTLRDQGLRDAEAAPGLFYGALFVEPRGFEAIFRDDLPFTNRSDGLWSPP